MHMRKRFVLASAALLAVTMAAGCSSNNTPAASNSASPKSGGEASSSAQPSSAAPSDSGSASSKLSEKPLELTIHLHYGGGGVGGDQVFHDDWAIFKKAAELTNISLKGTASQLSTNSQEEFNLMLASGSLPDIIHYQSKADMNKLGADGGLIPLNDLIDQYAPNLKEFWDERPDVRRYATSADGNIYFIPYVPDGDASTGWFIRQDWLDKLNLQMPTNADEYYKVLQAFRDGDPNGNGKKDEIPYFNRQSFGVYYLLNLWDSGTGYKIDPATDTVMYDPIQPNFKIGMSNLAKWYQEGLIDKEIFTRKGDVRAQVLGDNLGGSTHDWFGSTAGYNNTVKDKVPNIKLIPFAPPASVSGVQAEYDYRATIGTSGWGISSANKHPIETIKYMDFWFSDVGRTLFNFGIEGETYTMVDGKPTFTPDFLAQGDVLGHLKKYGSQIEIATHQDFEYEKQWMDPIALQGSIDYIQYIKKMGVPDLNYTVEEQEKLQQLEGQIETYRTETSQKWLLGGESVDAGFDAYLKKMKELGIDEVLKIKNDAYTRYKNS